MTNLHDVRRDYTGAPLPEDVASLEPWDLLADWLNDALAVGEPEPTAVTLATVDADGRPQSRVVLLKEASPDGLVVFSSYESAKARDLEAHPAAAISLWWPLQMRQVRTVGTMAKLSRERNEAYFAKRPRESQLEAWASHQSAPLERRDRLEVAVEEARQRFDGVDVPCPPYWGGYVLDVDTFEFWQGLPGRLHDRVRCTRTADGWRNVRLQP
ncbi:pyridoxamine 5'-phosphate oxidase [Tessaracoccus lubricantis]|uniref:Pyridoxine/pyridoxamine 5'-phosphate oxidase n=1 Tax=Tessaracoccus lubricantis TaxID=545543 RepID=A0ABP9F3E8_9ACTN